MTSDGMLEFWLDLEQAKARLLLRSLRGFFQQKTHLV
jgi:hypothetical protein